jgi:hypothetical protein
MAFSHPKQAAAAAAMRIHGGAVLLAGQVLDHQNEWPLAGQAKPGQALGQACRPWHACRTARLRAAGQARPWATQGGEDHCSSPCRPPGTPRRRTACRSQRRPCCRSWRWP